jgi:hypothetical protein
MTDPTLTGSPERQAIPPRRAAAPWLALVAVALAVPLAGDLAAVAQDPLRDLVALGGGTLWAGVALALVLGLLAAALFRPARWLRPGIGLGAALAVVVAGGTAAWQQAAGPVPAIQGCAQSVRADGGLRLAARASIDGVTRGRFAGVRIGPAEDAAGVVALIDGLHAAAVEDIAIEHVFGGVARHCRALVSGSQVTAALPTLSEGGANAERLVPAELPVWRGDFDWWVSAEGALVGATFRIGGHPADAWPSRGQQGLLTVELLPEPTPMQP